MSSGLTSQHVLPTSEPIYVPTELSSVLTDPRSTQPPDPPALPTSCTLSSLGTSPTPFGIPSSVQDTLSPYNVLGTSILEPKSPFPSSPSSMSTGNGEPTKSSSPGGEISTPPITTGPVASGTPFQNSSPMFGPTTSDICSSTSILSGVSPLPSSNGPALGTPSITTSVPLQFPTKLPVTSTPPVLLGQQTPSQSPSVTIPSTTSNSMTTTSTSTYITATEPVSTGSSRFSSILASTYPATSTSSTSFQHNDHSQTIPTSVASSSQSVFSSTLSSTNIPNPVKSSTTTSSSTDSITYTSLSFQGPSPTNASAPTSTTTSSQKGTISSVLSNSTQNPQNSIKSSAATSSSSVPTGSSSSTSESSKQNDPQTTAITTTSTSSSQERPILSSLSSTVSQTDTQNPVKISTTTSTVPTDSTTYIHNSSKQNPQTTALTSASVSTSSFHGGSITSMSSGEVSPASSSSTENSLPTPSPDKVPTTPTLNSPTPGPTNSPNTTFSLTGATGYPTTISGADIPDSQSSSEDIPSVTANAPTSVTYSPGDPYTSLTVQPSGDLTESSSLTAHGTTAFVEHGPSSVVRPENVIVSATSSTSTVVPEGENLSSFITTSTSFSYSTSIGASSTSVKTYTFTSTFITSTLIPTSGATTRSNEAAVIGGTIGGFLVVLVLSVAACCFVRRRRRSRYHQQLCDNELTAPLSPETIEAMRGTHGQIMSESRDGMRHASGSSVSSGLASPRPAALRFISEFHTRTSSGSVFHENISVSNDGYTSSGEESGGTERDFASAQSLYSSDGRESGENVDLGIAIRSESSVDLDSYCTAATTLAPLSHAPVDSDDSEELESPGPSPSSFPIPPGSNPFLDMVQNTDYPEFGVSRVLHGMDAVSAATGSAAVTPTNFQAQHESWTAAVAAASSTDAETPEATRDLNIFTERNYVIAVNDSSREDIKVPAQPALATPLGNPSVIDIINPPTPQEGPSSYSRNNESQETDSISRVHFGPFESKDRGKAKAHLSADLMNDARRNRLSNASSGLEFPENASQCGIAL